ncbi:MAG TPA: hypothetical protein V6C85_01810 [Allocoleopsis sp.]
MLVLAVAPQGKQMAQEAPQLLSRSLLRQPCVNTGRGNWGIEEEDVSVGKALYTSRLYLGPGDRSAAAITCKIQPNRAGVIFQTLNLAFGMRDNDQGSPSATVNVYLDGVKAESRTVSPGSLAAVTLDVTNTKNVTLEATCSGRYCDRVYIWNADLGYAPIPKKP